MKRIARYFKDRPYIGWMLFFFILLTSYNYYATEVVAERIRATKSLVPATYDTANAKIYNYEIRAKNGYLYYNNPVTGYWTAVGAGLADTLANDDTYDTLLTNPSTKRFLWKSLAIYGSSATSVDKTVTGETILWNIKEPVWSFVSSSDATTTGQSLTNITGLTFACAANTVYEFEANLTVSTSAVTTGTQYGVQYSAAGAAVEATIGGSLTSSSSQHFRISALNTASGTFLTTSGQSGGIVIKGILTTGANTGNLTIQHLKVTSGTSTVFINSFLKVTRVQTNAP